MVMGGEKYQNISRFRGVNQGDGGVDPAISLGTRVCELIYDKLRLSELEGLFSSLVQQKSTPILCGALPASQAY